MKVGIMLSNQQLASTDMVSALEEHPKRPMASFDAMVITCETTPTTTRAELEA